MARAIPASLTSRDASESIAAMEADPTKACDQVAGAGFIQLNALRLKSSRKVQ